MVVGSWQDAPYRCDHCRRGFFTSELSEGTSFRVPQHDFGFGETAKAVRRGVKGEVAAALERGSCVTEAMLPLLSKTQRAALAGSKRLSASFAAAVKAV